MSKVVTAYNKNVHFTPFYCCKDVGLALSPMDREAENFAEKIKRLKMRKGSITACTDFVIDCY